MLFTKYFKVLIVNKWLKQKVKSKQELLKKFEIFYVNLRTCL